MLGKPVLMLMCVGVVIATSAAGQERRRPPVSEQTPPAYVVDLRVYERWIHRRQDPRTVHFAAREESITIDSLSASSNGALRDYFVHVGANPARIRLAGAAVPAMRGAWSPPDVGSFDWSARDPHRSFNVRLGLGMSGTNTLSLFRDVLEDVVPTFRPPALRVGASWRDTIHWVATHDSLRLRLDVARISWLERDSSTDGRLRWFVRDSATVRYAAELDLPDFYRVAVSHVQQRMSGTTVGRALIDVERQLLIWRRDSSSWSGEATLQEEGASPVTTPARYERVRQWTGFDAQAYVASRARRREMFWRVGPPNMPEYENWPTPPTNGPPPTQVDSAFAVKQLGKRVDARGRERRHLQLDEMRTFVDWLEDAQRRWDHGVARSELLGILTGPLETEPMATSDTSRWPCTPEACALLVTRAAASRSPVVRDLALMLQFSMQPAAHAARLRERGAREPSMFGTSLRLLDGVGPQWPARASKAPPPGSDWRRWLDWMSGWSMPYTAPAWPATEGASTLNPPFWSWQHREALLIHGMATGRDIRRELQLAFDSASEDSARLVYGTALVHLRETRLPLDTVLAWFATGSRPMQAIARTEVRLATERLLPIGPPALPESALPQALRDSLVSLVLSEIITEMPVTPIEWVVDSARGVAAPRNAWLHPAPPPDTAQRLVAAEDWPAGLPARLQSRFRTITRGARDSLPTSQTIHVMHIDASVRMGPYVVVAFSTRSRLPNFAERPGRAYASGTFVVLAPYKGRWVEVGRQGWMT